MKNLQIKEDVKGKCIADDELRKSIKLNKDYAFSNVTGFGCNKEFGKEKGLITILDKKSKNETCIKIKFFLYQNEKENTTSIKTHVELFAYTGKIIEKIDTAIRRHYIEIDCDGDFIKDYIVSINTVNNIIDVVPQEIIKETVDIIVKSLNYYIF